MNCAFFSTAVPEKEKRHWYGRSAMRVEEKRGDASKKEVNSAM
jgi:hypothetical protein